jgi:membrane protease YdiL (CAAX protease family)
MTLFALLPPPGRARDLVVLVDIAFVLYAVASFIRVAGYASVQVRKRRLIGGPRAPLPFPVTGLVGSLFALSVLALLYGQSALYIVLVFLGLAFILQQAGRTADEQFGFRRLGPGALLKWSFLICGAVIFVEVPLGFFLDRGMNLLHLPHPEQDSVEVFRHITRPGEIAAFLLQAVILSPLLEELFFRGFLFTFLKKYTSTSLALVLSAGVFAFAHLNLGAVIPLWVLGLVLGIAYEHSGSLVLPFGIHACWNLLTAFSLLLERGGG